MKLQVILILFISLSLEAQNVEIKGRIIDGESGAALPDAYIVYQKKSLGAIADRDGSFNISIPEELIDGDTIYFTHLGYITLPVSCQKAINMVEFEMKPASYALPEIEIRVPEREKNWKDVFVQAVQEYQSRRRKRPFIALGQYVEEANYRDTPIMYMESLGYIVFMGELHKASSYSNMKFFCDQTRAYVTNSEWVKYNKNPGSPISDAPVLPGAVNNINTLRVIQEDGLLATKKARRYRCNLDSSYMMRQYPVYILGIKHNKEYGKIKIIEMDGHYLIHSFQIHTDDYWSSAWHKRLPAQVSVRFQYYQNTPFVKRISAIQRKDDLEYRNDMVSIIQKLDTFSLSPEEYWDMNLYSLNPWIKFNADVYDEYALDEFRNRFLEANSKFQKQGIDLENEVQDFSERWFSSTPGEDKAIEWMNELRDRIF